MTTTSVSDNLLSTTIYNHGTLSTTSSGPKSTPGSYFPYPTDLYNHTIFTEPSKTSTTDSQKMSTTPTNSIEASQHVRSATASSVYRLITTVTVLNEASKSTIGTEVTTHYNNYTTTTASSTVSVEQQMTTTQYKAITRSRSGDIAFSFNTLPLSTSTNMYQAPRKKHLTTVCVHTTTISFNSPSTTKHHDYSTYVIGPTKTSNGPQLVTTILDESSTTIHESEKGTNTELPTGTEQGTVIDTDPSLFTTVTAEKSTQAVTLREAVAWALLSLMTLFFTVLCIHISCRQKRDNKAQTAAYEMADESSKTSNTLEMNIYELIECICMYCQLLLIIKWCEHNIIQCNFLKVLQYHCCLHICIHTGIYLI